MSKENVQGLAVRVDTATYPADTETESLFERFHWFYAFCREHLFRDDTECIATALWPEHDPPEGTRLLEIGCGPGFYACGLAERFSQLQVTGVDRAKQQLCRARSRAAAKRLGNCLFAEADVLDLSYPQDAFSAIVASRLFTILPERKRALEEIHRVLLPGGRCFIAEPRSMLRAAIPLHTMWLLAHLIGFCRESPGSYREPRQIAVMRRHEFRGLIESQPWRRMSYWHDAWYQYVVCEKEGH